MRTANIGRLVVAVVLGWPATTAMAAEAAPRPNIIFILADDLGYGDLGCYGQKKIKTPHIDRLAAEGMRFTQFYCGCSVCAPSRCTLMTGKHLGHATVRDNMQRGKGLEGQHPMEPGTVTVAQLLRKAGYATAIVGKWGLGMPEDHSSPLDFGFDHHFGYLCQGMAHTYYPPYLWRDNGAANLLAELGLASTPVALHSDNSAAYAGLSPDFFHSNGNLRGYKEQLYEGGIRTPFIARWPGRIKAGTISTLVGAFWDMLPRLCELAGSPAPADIDGLSIVPTLLGQPGQKLHQYLYWEYHSAGGAQAVRFGDWKAVCNNAKRFPYAMPKLYDLARDPGEKTNLADQFPELAAKAAGYMKAAHSPSKEAKWDF